MNENEKSMYNEVLNHYFTKNKIKKYFGRKEILEITGISLRTYKYRINELKVKYKDVPSLLFKEQNKWKIHNSIAEEFLPKRKSANQTINSMKWESFSTWNLADNYDEEFHYQIINEIKESHPHNLFHYVIEKTKMGVNHVHLISDLSVEEVENTANEVFNHYQIPINLNVQQIINKTKVIRYLNK